MTLMKFDSLVYNQNLALLLHILDIISDNLVMLGINVFILRSYLKYCNYLNKDTIPLSINNVWYKWWWDPILFYDKRAFFY